MRLSCIGAALAAAVGLFSRPAAASDAGELSLYQAMEIVTGTDMRERPRGFALCLKDVLVKVSGDPRLRSDPRVAAAAKHAADYVAAFDYIDPIASTRHHDDQGTYDRSENLTVTFNPAKIDALLGTLGERPWQGPRPVLEPVLSVRGRTPPAYRLTADEPLAAEQRGALERIAGEAGLHVKFPSATEFGQWGAVPSKAPCGPESTMIVVGTMTWSETAPGWLGEWRLCRNGKRYVWTTHGGGFDLAFLSLVQGAMLLASGNGVPDMR